MPIPDKLKETKEYKQLTKLYVKQTSNSISEDPSNYSSFDNWMDALYKIDKRNPDEFLPEYGLTVREFRKQIWDIDKNNAKVLSFQDFKRKWKKSQFIHWLILWKN